MLIVTYHAIARHPPAVCTSADRLAADLAGLREAGFRFVSLDETAAWLQGRLTLPERSVAITFDDGYQSAVQIGIPLLAAMKIPATVFVIARRVGGDNTWPGQWATVPPMPLARAHELRELSKQAFSIGAHSLSHARLPELPQQEMRREVIQSGDDLEQMLGAPVRHFAYPYGLRNAAIIEAARTRYATASNADPGIVSTDAPAHDLPRIDPHDLRLALRLGLAESGGLGRYLALRRWARRVRRRVEAVTR